MAQTLSARMDEKGRLAIPKSIRDELGAQTGDTFFFEREGNVVRLAKAENPFDSLAEHAEDEYRAGRTRNLRDFAAENDIPLDER